MADTISLTEALQLATETRCLEIGAGVLNQIPQIFRRHFGPRPAIIVADTITFALAGRRISDAFRSAGQPCREPFIFNDPALYAEHRYVEQLEAALRAHDAIPVAIGSGTINDLAKLASHRTGRPYMSVASAASMDGYTAFGASITYQGSKQTFSCPAPVAVVADLDLICAAPPEMNASGYADLLAKITSGADWLVADALGIEPIGEQAWNIVQGGLRAALANPSGVRAGQPEAVRNLTEGLMLGGLAMQHARSSRPASGAEHQFSHLWDMQQHAHNGQAPSHGFKVGIGTLAIAALYERLLDQPIEELDVERCCAASLESSDWESQVGALFAEEELRKVALRETRAKTWKPDELRARLERLRSVWPELRPRLREQLLPVSELRRRLQAVGAPVAPEQIGISPTRLRQTYRQAFFIRRRFTILDVAVRTGLLERCLEQIFGF